MWGLGGGWIYRGGCGGCILTALRHRRFTGYRQSSLTPDQCSGALGSTSRLLYFPWCSVHLGCQERKVSAATLQCVPQHVLLQGINLKTIQGAALFWCEELLGYCRQVITLCRLTEFVSKWGYFNVLVSLFAPSLLQNPPSILNIYCKKSLAQPVIIVPTSHALKWRLSKNSIKSEFC